MGSSSSKVTPLSRTGAGAWKKWNQDLRMEEEEELPPPRLFCFFFGYEVTKWVSHTNRIRLPSHPTVAPQDDEEWQQAIEAIVYCLQTKMDDALASKVIMEVVDILLNYDYAKFTSLIHSSSPNPEDDAMSDDTAMEKSQSISLATTSASSFVMVD